MRETLGRHSFSIAFLLILFGSLYFYADRDAEIQQLSGYTMGTTYQIQIVDMPTALSEEQVANDVTEILTRLDTNVFSTYATNSELSRFNRHGVNVPFIASSQLLEVMHTATSRAASQHVGCAIQRAEIFAPCTSSARHRL